MTSPLEFPNKGTSTMHLNDFRLECMKLAVEARKDMERPEDVVNRARAFADFVNETGDGKLLSAAREFAEKVKNV